MTQIHAYLRTMSLKNLYHQINLLLITSVLLPNLVVIASCSWIWKLKLPEYIRHFSSITIYGKLLTNYIRYIYHMMFDVSCERCGAASYVRSWLMIFLYDLTCKKVLIKVLSFLVLCGRLKMMRFSLVLITPSLSLNKEWKIGIVMWGVSWVGHPS